MRNWSKFLCYWNRNGVCTKLIMIPTLNSATSFKVQGSENLGSRREEDGSSEDLTNAELYLKRSKKRGLYVETENADVPASATEHPNRLLPASPQPQRFLPRDQSPLPGRSNSKPFIWSVLDDSTPGTSESDIHEANKQIRSTIEEIQNAIKDIRVTKFEKPDTTSKENKDKDNKNEIREDQIQENAREPVHIERNRNEVNEILKVEKKELTLTMKTVCKERIKNRFSFRYVHDEDNSSTSSQDQTNEADATIIPDAIKIRYKTNKVKRYKTTHTAQNMVDLNSNRTSMQRIEDDSTSNFSNDYEERKKSEPRKTHNNKLPDAINISYKNETQLDRRQVRNVSNINSNIDSTREDDTSTYSEDVKYKSEARKRKDTVKIPDAIQITYKNDKPQHNEERRKRVTKYVSDLNSNKQSMFHIFDSPTEQRNNGNESRLRKSFLNPPQSSSKYLVVIQHKKDFSGTSQSLMSDSEELEVLDIDLNDGSNQSVLYPRTVMGNNFYTNNNDRSKVMRKENAKEYSSDDNEVFGIYSNYNDDEPGRSEEHLEVPFVYDSVDKFNRREHAYDLVRYLLDEKGQSYGKDPVYRASENYSAQGMKRPKRIYIPKKPAIPDYTRKNRRTKRPKTFLNAEKRRRYIEKEKLINMIKQRLSMDFVNMEPPKSVFEELKEMAKNKRRKHKTVSFSNEWEDTLYMTKRNFNHRTPPDKSSQMKKKYLKRHKKNPQSIIRANNEIYKDMEFFSKVQALNKRGFNKRMMSPAYVNKKINEIHGDLSDMEEEDDTNLEEDISLEVINM